jgi:hypothetical protein
MPTPRGTIIAQSQGPGNRGLARIVHDTDRAAQNFGWRWRSQHDVAEV